MHLWLAQRNSSLPQVRFSAEKHLIVWGNSLLLFWKHKDVCPVENLFSLRVEGSSGAHARRSSSVSLNWRIFSRVALPGAHAIGSSSVMSPQSLSPSHTQPELMHLPLAHLKKHGLLSMELLFLFCFWSARVKFSWHQWFSLRFKPKLARNAFSFAAHHSILIRAIRAVIVTVAYVDQVDAIPETKSEF